MKINSKLRAYLTAMINPSNNDKLIKKSVWALNILERGYITESELFKLKLQGFKL